MSSENCPDCGYLKHQLNACSNCGFQRNKLYKCTSKEPILERDNSQKPNINKPKKIKKRSVVRASPKNEFCEKEQEHERRWRNIIQAGSPGLGKRR